MPRHRESDGLTMDIDDLRKQARKGIDPEPEPEPEKAATRPNRNPLLSCPACSHLDVERIGDSAGSCVASDYRCHACGHLFETTVHDERFSAPCAHAQTKLGMGWNRLPGTVRRMPAVDGEVAQQHPLWPAIELGVKSYQRIRKDIKD